MDFDDSHYPPVELDECKFLILKVIEQAIRDYISLSTSAAPVEREYYQTALDFLYDDNYRVDWGDDEKSLRDLLDIIDIDIVWFRERVARLKNKRCQERNLNAFWCEESDTDNPEEQD